jgi:uncharacterized protein (TIGR03435 family)
MRLPDPRLNCWSTAFGNHLWQSAVVVGIARTLAHARARYSVWMAASTDGADASPNLYTAIQEKIGLKLEATKANADVLVIDHVEKH